MQLVVRAAPAALVIGAVIAFTGCAPHNPQGTSAFDSKTARYVAEQAKLYAQGMRIKDPPTVKLVRFVLPDEWAPAQVQCLRKAGFHVGLTPDGEGVSFPRFGDKAFEDQLRLASYTCQVEYMVPAKYQAPLTRAQLHRLYVYRSTELVRCLEGLGHAPAVRAPSESYFVETKGAWTPYASASIPDSDLRRTTRACPQDPADLYR
ncbi:hypothetical protein LK09_17145 [Microbacterium mangrovi]|uniref:Lipoprotein n=1 Tax=Microbacterium mangrovi TaxID=1348253 RepID=A0A0B1ZXW1_9MICO|nr:hypothetical protein LK09_17145 [Microbacterium mangrovi]